MMTSGALDRDRGTKFKLDFAPHLGFPSPDHPQFAALAGSADPVELIQLAANHGFRCIQDPFTAKRAEAEQRRIGDAAAAAGLGLGCFVDTTIEAALAPTWLAEGDAARRVLDEQLENAIAIGKRMGSRYIAVLTGEDPSRSFEEQKAAMARNLARHANRVADEGMTICLEAVDRQRLPRMLLHHLSDAADVVRAVDHPAVRLIFDTAHVFAEDGDLFQNLDPVWDLIELVQLADYPGRVEPGAGTLEIESLLDELVRRGFAGPCELEHGWSVPGPDVQKEYLRWLERWAMETDQMK